MLTGKRVLVTGGAGFIGSHLVDAYVTAGCEVAVLDNFSTGNRANIAHQSVQIFEVDITDQAAVNETVDRFRPQIVSHHAAQVSVRHSLQDIRFDALTNVIGTINVLEAATAQQAELILVASSGGAVYGESTERRAFRETDERLPLSPYGISKLDAEYYIDFYRQHRSSQIVTFRYGNVFGPRQDPAGEAGVITMFLERFKKNEPVTIYGTGEQVRDFVSVDDIVSANLTASEKGRSGIYNVGSGKITSINQLYTVLATAWERQTGQTAPTMSHGEAIPGEVIWSELSLERIASELQWQPSVTLEDGLTKTIDWFVDRS